MLQEKLLPSMFAPLSKANKTVYPKHMTLGFKAGPRQSRGIQKSEFTNTQAKNRWTLGRKKKKDGRQ